MNRIDEKFAQLNKMSGKAFIPYITAGDPNLKRTRELVLELENSGADIIELGIPFSDPLADGKTNQEAAERALINGVTLADVINLVADLRKETQIPIVFFTYLNPVYQYGYEKFAADAAKAGVDGVLALDVPPEESVSLKKELDGNDVKMIFLITPTSNEERVKKITKQASGFIYYVSRTGVTGVTDKLSDDLEEQINLIRKYSNIPIAVGFGISKPEHVSRVAKIADGVIVGSAIVKKIADGGDSDEMVNDIKNFVRNLVKPIKK
ncbi:MAG: tryptophan synthase subunit alpha [Chlamydiae bacterium]|nr:MAG: tryptophan synthase subunit alpha [Chlamydiota bacterium]